MKSIAVGVRERGKEEEGNGSARYVSSDSGFTFGNSSRRSGSKGSRKESKVENQLVLRKTELARKESRELVPIYTLHIQMELCDKSLYEYCRQRDKLDGR